MNNIEKKISLDEKIFVAGASGMVGSATCRVLHKYGYGENSNGGKIFIFDLMKILLIILRIQKSKKLTKILKFFFIMFLY